MGSENTYERYFFHSIRRLKNRAVWHGTFRGTFPGAGVRNEWFRVENDCKVEAGFL